MSELQFCQCFRVDVTVGRSCVMLKGKVAVVTGSTSGIGLGIARALAAGGADLVINGFGEAASIEKLRQEIATTHGVRVAFGAADLTKPTDATGLIEHATRELGRVDVLVNNAGIQHTAPVHEFPIERWDAVIAINLTAVFLTTRAVLPQMLAGKPSTCLLKIRQQNLMSDLVAIV